MDKLGFTWYPKDWWTSDTFFKLPPELRYLYLEITSMLYMNDGYWEANRIELFRRFGVDPGDKGWELLESLFIVQGKFWTHESVNKRLRKAIASRENGKNGGRPKTQETQENNLKKPTLEREIEKEIEIKVKDKSKEKTLDWFKNQIDDIYLENLKMTHPGKDIDQALKEAYNHVASDSLRLQNLDGAGAKRLLNTWLTNSKTVKKQESTGDFLKRALG